MDVQRRFLEVILILILIIQFVLTQETPLSSSIERLSLLDLRSSLGLRSKDWPIRAEPCLNWTGVECRNGRVYGINVSGLRRTRLGRLNPQFSVDSLANFTLLVSFNASGFSLPGFIPDLFGRLDALQVLDLRSASVIGSIPLWLCNLNRLKILYLSGNNLAGELPAELGKLLELSVLDLSCNYFSGLIPPSLGSVSGLRFLNLSGNGLTGLIPGQLGNLVNLVELDLGKNSLYGSLPVELGGLRSLKKMVFEDNDFKGPLPVGLFENFAKLEVLVLSLNKFDGVLPDAMWSIPTLLFLDISSNKFTGVSLSLSSISIASGAMVNLSHNLFYGALTLQLRKFSLIDISSNYFQGNISDDSRTNAMLNQNCLQDVPNQRSLEDCQLFYAQRHIPFDYFGFAESTQPPHSRNSKRWIFILVGIFGGLGFIVILVCVLIVLIRTCDKGITSQRASANVGPIPERDSSLVPKDPTSVLGLGELFTYEQMLHLTGNFSETNLIKHGHSGDIFRGILESGISVVIKRVNLHSIKKETYLMELDLFSKASHTRLVPLLGHCLEHEREKLMVYKYMPNGDLANSLYRVPSPEDHSLQSLDWITRLKIATGAAEGLSYLHHECSPPLVHRDIQASSILLDDKFEVRLGSLSEVRAQEGDSHQNVLTRLLRKSQTFDQGPFGPSAICAYDVYCFGKVLLELITGKLGISKSDDATTKEWLEHTLPYISMYDKELLMKIVDPSLIVDEDLLDEVWAMAIVARSCLNPKPSRRPPMKYILKALENPLKIVREDNSYSDRLRTTSSRRSWSAAFFGSWRQSSFENATVLGHINSGSKQSGRVGSLGSSRHELGFSNKRLSNEIFPELAEMQDTDRQDDQ